MQPSIDAQTKVHVEQAMRDHVLDQAELIGTYERMTVGRA